MYVQAGKIEQAYGTTQRLRKDGKVAEAGAFAAENRSVLAQYRNIERVKRAEGKLGASIRQIENSDRSGDEKPTLHNELLAAEPVAKATFVNVPW
jgi:hypothetical protein